MKRETIPDYRNYLKLLSQKDFIEESIYRFLMACEELSQRNEALTEFMKTLCRLNVDTWIWFTLWESGGTHNLMELLRYADCSETTLRRKLHSLWTFGLVRKVNGKYTAVSPAWLRARKGN